MSLLGIKTLQIQEYFWYGDVFITRFHEDDDTFEFSCEDVPRTFLGCKKLLTNLIWSYWENKEPENAIFDWQYAEAKQEKLNADKQIILGRMSKIKREILKQMPWMLEYLAITTCDGDALVDANIRKSKNHPGMPEVSVGDHCRTIAIKAVAKANGLDLEIRETPRTPEHLSISKLGKVPAFEGADGFKLFECMAIALYITSQNEQTTLLGGNKKEYAEIIKWMSFFNNEIVILMTQQLLPQLGVIPYDKDQVELFTNMTQKCVDVAEEYLQDRTFLVGEQLSLADLFCAANISLGFQFFYGTAWRQQNPNVSRWYEMICHQPIYAAVTDKFQLLDEPKLTNNPPQKKPETAPESVAAVA
ncbi:hypothetical protein CNMCM7691_006518 [Aspergillus felis]|nr:hypothetical protein CNMCM7691_006518 [Aspergillus felis]